MHKEIRLLLDAGLIFGLLNLALLALFLLMRLTVYAESHFYD